MPKMGFLSLAPERIPFGKTVLVIKFPPSETFIAALTVEARNRETPPPARPPDEGRDDGRNS